MWGRTSLICSGLLVVLVSGGEARSAPAVYEVAARPRVAVLLSYGSQGRVATGDTTEILGAFDRALEERTRLIRDRAPNPRALACVDDFLVLDVCVFEALFPNAGVQLAADPPRSVEDILGTSEAPRLVVNISVAQDEMGQRVARFRVFSSTTAASRIAEARLSANRQGVALDREELQLTLTREAVRRIKFSGVASLSDPRLYRDFFDQIEDLLRGYGKAAELRISSPSLPEGAVLSYDGKVLGPVTQDGVRLTHVIDGVHEIEVAAPDHDPVRATVTMVGGKSREVELLFAGSAGRWARRGVLYTGIGFTAGGLAALTVGALNATTVTCVPLSTEVADTCPDSGQVGLTGADLSSGGELSATISAAAVGSALLGAGVSWTLGALLWGEEDEVPWVPIIIGVAAGVVAGGAVIGAQSL